MRANLPTLHSGQQPIAESTTRHRVVACGRRFGKTTMAMIEAIQAADAGQSVWWVLPAYDMATETWDAMIDLLQDYAKSISHSKRYIYFESGGTLGIKSAHKPRSLRGRGLDLIVIDEAAYCDEVAWHTLRPALSDKQGRALIISTPNGLNWFYRLWHRGNDPLDSEWASWQMPSTANPIITPEEVEQARRDMPARQFEEEYLAKFNTDYGTVFVNFMACVAPAGETSGKNIMGVDWGRIDDFTVATILNPQGQMIHMERFPHMEYQLQRARLATLAHKYNVDRVIAESNSMGLPNIEALRSDHGLRVEEFNTTQNSKDIAIRALALAFEQERITILDDDILLNELQAYEMQRTANGWRYGAPSGMHDDTVMALALAWHGVNAPRGAVVEMFRPVPARSAGRRR